MSDERSSPGVGPRTWVTLGLLLLSWAVVITLITLKPARFTATPGNVEGRFLIGTFALGAHALLGVTAWRYRRVTWLAVTAHLLAFSYSLLSLLILGTAILSDLGPALRNAGLSLGPPPIPAYLAWGAGLLTAGVAWCEPPDEAATGSAP